MAPLVLWTGRCHQPHHPIHPFLARYIPYMPGVAIRAFFWPFLRVRGFVDGKRQSPALPGREAFLLSVPNKKVRWGSVVDSKGKRRGRRGEGWSHQRRAVGSMAAIEVGNDGRSIA